jgi:DNA-binding GntR family transcriptional regulator
MHAEPRTIIERPRSLTALAVEKLRDAITDGRIPFGTLLSEKTIAGLYGTSKTPIREAFVELRSLGLVEVIPQRGCLVVQPTAEQVRELCEFRLELESAALRFSMQRNRRLLLETLTATLERMADAPVSGAGDSYHHLDDLFHKAFFVACGNALLSATYSSLSARIQALRANLQTPSEFLLSVSKSEHRQIVDTIAADDINGALATLAAHITRVSDAYTALLDSAAAPQDSGPAAAA